MKRKTKGVTQLLRLWLYFYPCNFFFPSTACMYALWKNNSKDCAQICKTFSGWTGLFELFGQCVWSRVQPLLRQHQQHQVKLIQRPWWLTMTVVPSGLFNFVTGVKNNSTLSLKGAAEYCIGKMKPKQLLIWLIHYSLEPVKGACSTSEDRHRHAELCKELALADIFNTPTNSQQFSSWSSCERLTN